MGEGGVESVKFCIFAENTRCQHAMSFISIAFLLFLPLVFALYWSAGGRSFRWQNVVLASASLVFYGWADWRFVFLLLASALVSWGCGVLMTRGTAGRGAIAASGIVLNLGVLFAFKYYDFFVASFANLVSALGGTAHFGFLSLALPVGISFYTFQAVAYIVDVKRGQAQAATHFVDFLAFLSFFPQLVAGPIERASSLLVQMQTRRRFDSGLATDGMRQMLWGLAKKVIVADNCAPMVEQTWHDLSMGGVSSMQLWMGAVLFALQIYADFSGYCDIALGAAKLFGLRLSRNFINPFFSRDMGELWRRWHVTLMQWFRDYVYIPLGGNRRGNARRVLNVMIVFALSGLWHGAAWTFVAWGVFNGVWVILWNRRRHSLDAPPRFSLWMPLTFLLFAVGFVFFRAPDLHAAYAYLAGMVTRPVAAPYGWHALAYGSAMLALEWLTRRRQHALQWNGTGLLAKRLCRWTVYYLLAVAVVVMLLSAERVAFIYFRF